MTRAEIFLGECHIRRYTVTVMAHLVQHSQDFASFHDDSTGGSPRLQLVDERHRFGTVDVLGSHY